MDLFLVGDAFEQNLVDLLTFYLQLQKSGDVIVHRLSQGTNIAIQTQALLISVPCLVTAEGKVATSLLEIIQRLVRQTKWGEVLVGADQFKSQAVRECIDRFGQADIDLNALHSFLEPKTFLVSNHITLADLYVFVRVQSRVAQWTEDDKQKYHNVFRWFRHIQNLEGIQDFLVQKKYAVVSAPVRRAQLRPLTK